MRLEIGRYMVVELLGAGVSIEEIIRDYYPSLNDKMSREVL
jgi:uncharacterized protein (DUF433 family)